MTKEKTSELKQRANKISGDLLKYYIKIMGKSISRYKTKCIEFQGSKSSFGYGRIHINGKHYMAHRIVYQHINGEIPDGKIVCHSCDNPPCVNADHLFLGTDQENISDCVKKGRDFHPIGDLHHNKKLCSQQVLDIRELYATGRYTQKQMAEAYHVHRTNISAIIRRKSWTHI